MNRTKPKFFHTSDYPDGLVVYVNGSVVYSFCPRGKTVDGAGWAEAAFSDDVAPSHRPEQPEQQ